MTINSLGQISLGFLQVLLLSVFFALKMTTSILIDDTDPGIAAQV